MPAQPPARPAAQPAAPEGASWIANMRIRTKVVAAIGVLLALMLGLSAALINGMNRMDAANDDVAENWMPSIEQVNVMRYELARHRGLVARAPLSHNAEELQRSDRDIEQIRAALVQRLDTYARTLVSPGEEGLMAATRSGIEAYLATVPRVLEPSRAGNREAAARAFWATSEEFGRADAAVLRQIEFNKTSAGKATAQAAATFDASMLKALVAIAVSLVVAVTIGFLMNGAIARPVQGMTAAMRELAEGRLETAVPARGRRDEIGAMAEAVQVFKDNAVKARADEAEKTARAEADARRAANLQGAIAGFESSIGAVVQTVAGAANDVTGAAQAPAATAEQTNRQSSAVSAATEEASANVQTVAASSEELAASISEISRQVASSAQIAARAVGEAQATNARIESLSAAATQIGDVVKLIGEIAGKTNLLALNATIEAARAGEAGKGFAVVAAEVKTLANQTARATDEIGAKVAEMQGATSDSVAAIQGIAKVIEEINEIATSIASAVEQQGAATAEIARNVQQAARGTQDVASNIGGVTRAAGETGTAAQQMLGAAGRLSEQAGTLRSEVDGFLARVRAA